MILDLTLALFYVILIYGFVVWLLMKWNKKMYKRYTLQDTLDSEKRNLFNVLSTLDLIGGDSSTGYRLSGGKDTNRLMNLYLIIQKYL